MSRSVTALATLVACLLFWVAEPLPSVAPRERTHEVPSALGFAAGRLPWLPDSGNNCTKPPCACGHSGLCSYRHTKPWIGPIRTLRDWVDALEARSYRKEVRKTPWPMVYLIINLYMRLDLVNKILDANSDWDYTVGKYSYCN